MKLLRRLWWILSIVGALVLALIVVAVLTPRAIELGEERELVSEPWDFFQWSPDGSRLLLTGDRSGQARLAYVDVPSGQLHALPQAGFFALWSPDGRRILILDRDPPEPISGAWVYDLEPPALLPIHGFPEAEGVHAWTEQGLVYQTGTGLWLAALELPGPAEEGAPSPRISDPRLLLAYDARDPARWSYPAPDLGAFLLSDNTDLERRRWWLVQADGDRQEMDGGLYNLGICCRWSPNGGRLAYFVLMEGEQSLYLADQSGEAPKMLVRGDELGPGAFLALDFSPDGEMLAFVYAPQGEGFPFEENQIYVVGAGGRGLRQVTDHPGHGHNWLSWSPDGRQLAFRDASGHLRVAEVFSK